MGKKYYKVVRQGRYNTENVYDSCRTISPELKCSYSLNKWTYPLVKGSKLMVFDNLSDAITFIINTNTYDLDDIIFECEVKKPSKKWAIFRWLCVPQENTYIKICKLRLQKKKFTHLLDKDENKHIPYGTVFCDAVKLLKKVD